jgi:hypothetical protein
MKYTQLSNTPNMPRYIDAKIVAQGEVEEMTYIEPSTCLKAKK